MQLLANAVLRVTKLTDYATVVLTVLAAETGQVFSASELAERACLEPPTVSKVLKPLARAGLVEGFRGVHGGYRLARPPEAISLADVVEAMEGPIGMTECSVQHGQCGIEHRCGIRTGWRQVSELVADALRAVSLAHLVNPAPHGPKHIAVRLAAP